MKSQPSGKIIPNRNPQIPHRTKSIDIKNRRKIRENSALADNQLPSFEPQTGGAPAVGDGKNQKKKNRPKNRRKMGGNYTERSTGSVDRV